MKKNILLIIFFIFIGYSQGFDNQGFTDYKENLPYIEFKCNSQCFIISDELLKNNFIEIGGNIEGDGVIGYGFINGNQIIPGNFDKIEGKKIYNQSYNLNKLPFFDQIPKQTKISIIVEGNINANNFRIKLYKSNIFDNLKSGIQDSLNYIPYNPRTINFLEYPMWNGKYINQKFFLFIILIIFFCLIGYLLTRKIIIIYIGVSLFGFFWLLFDFFSSFNQYKFFKQISNNSNIMNNGRMGEDSDFYDYINFIKQSIPENRKGEFLSPYPFFFEGKYHIYPYVKFDKIEKVDYIFWYNPYGPSAPFSFKDPIISGNILYIGQSGYNIDKQIFWKNHGKIYQIKH